jgi:predicted nuclease of predicted toxin-antitoxin system
VRIYADENVALSVIDHLRSCGHDIVRIAPSDLSAADPAVLDLASNDQRTLLTFDSDFGKLTVKDGVTAPFGILYCRLSLLENRQAGTRIAEVLAEISDIANRIVVVGERRHRIRGLIGSTEEE